MKHGSIVSHSQYVYKVAFRNAYRRYKRVNDHDPALSAHRDAWAAVRELYKKILDKKYDVTCRKIVSK